MTAATGEIDGGLADDPEVAAFDASLDDDRREPDPRDIRRFARTMFKNADAGSYASLRAFPQTADAAPAIIRAVPLMDGLAAVIEAAIRMAGDASNGTPMVFCPPVATFKTPDRADEATLANGLVISVELDSGDTAAARRRLEAILGPLTAVVLSGGDWSDPETGEVHPKVHLHWRLREPTRARDDHDRLKHARRLASMLVGTDRTALPIVHPLRWPGSWHLKAKPILARLAALNADAEIDLSAALEALEAAVEAVGLDSGETGQRVSGEPQADIALIASAMAAIPNAPPPEGDGDEWPDYRQWGLALFAATGGSPEGREVYREWSAKSDKHDDATLDADWAHFAKSPPSRIGAGTIFFTAKRWGWTWPVFSGVPQGAHRIMDLPALAGLPIPERRWIVPDWLPEGTVTSLLGDGGTGKTLAAQQLMTATALARPWFGMAVAQCRSVGLFCEDDEDELHRRQARIAAHYNASLSDLDGVGLISGVGLDNFLVTFDHNNRQQVCALLAKIEDWARASDARLVVLDTAADLFGGNENDRSQVRQFLGTVLGGLAGRLGAAVLLNAHPSRAGMSATGDMDGGSTAWNNSVRSRWSLSRPPKDGDGPTDPDARILTRRKANYASIGASINLRWSNGVLIPAGLGSDGDATDDARGQVCKEAFLRLLDQSKQMGAHVCGSLNATNYAPRVFAKGGNANGFRKSELEQAMHALFEEKRICVVRYGRPSDQRSEIVRASPGCMPRDDDDV